MQFRYKHPMQTDIPRLREHCNLEVHVGHGWIEGAGSKDCLDVQIVYPPHGNCLILLAGQKSYLPSRGLWKNLEASGDSPDGSFNLECPQFLVHATSPPFENIGWAVATPANGAMKITYLPAARPKTISVLINNFDFSWGDVSSDSLESRMESRCLTVEADGRPVVFQKRDEYSTLKRLVGTGVIPSASLMFFSFEAWDGATEENLNMFAHDIASLCALIAQQHAGIPVLSFLDDRSRVISRLIGNPIESPYRESSVFGDHVPDGIKGVFRTGFVEHSRMQQAALPWRKLWSYCVCIEDPPYLEQKFASLMMALEFFMKNSLLEGTIPPTAAEVEKMDLNKLIGECRSRLGWNVPGHYTTRDLHRLLRNAVMHGGELPLKDSAEFRRAFDKWRLFLIRRVLMRLGYDGSVLSPDCGWVGSSPVDDFSESHNSFEPVPDHVSFNKFKEAISKDSV